MPKASPIWTNFTAGELSPRLDGRVDIEKYFNAAKTLYNMIVQPHGPATRRGGTKYVAETRNTASSVRLVPFEFSNQQAYIIEVGHEYMRFFMDHGAIATPAGVDPYEIATTINQASLPYLKYSQSADEMYITSSEGDMPPAQLIRNNHASWTINDIAFTADPFGGATGYPRVAGFFEQRSVWANVPASPQRMWLSATGAYTDLTLGAGDDDAIDIVVAADNVNPIMWIAPMRVMVFGTTGGEWRVGSEGYTTPVSPTNIIVRREANYGSEDNFLPEVVGPVILYIQRHGRRVRELAYDYALDGWDAPDLTLLAEHLSNPASSGSSFEEMAYCQEPDSILWCRREDGSFVGCTYNRMQSVAAWHRHETEGEIESIARIPGDGRDELWMEVKRTIGGKETRHIEVMMDPDFADAEDAWYLDDALQYDGAAATTIAGLSHLNGASVGVLADGAAVPQTTVNAGSVVLNNAASVVLVGLPFTSKLQTMRVEGGSALGTSQTKKKKVTSVAVRLFRSAGFQAGYTEDDMDVVPVRTTGDAMSRAVPLFTGDKEVREFPGGWNREGYVWVQQDQPLPLTVQAIIANIETSDY